MPQGCKPHPDERGVRMEQRTRCLLSWQAVAAKVATVGVAWDLAAEETARVEAVKILQRAGLHDDAELVHHATSGTVAAAISVAVKRRDEVDDLLERAGFSES